MWSIRAAGAALLVALAVIGAGLRPAQAQNVQSFTLAPGASATVTFEAFCLDFGRDFPETVQAPQRLADEPVRAALDYIQRNGIAGNQERAVDAQYAIWELSGAADVPQGSAVYTDVLNASSTALAAAPQGTSVVDAAGANQVRVTIGDWQPLGQEVQVGTVTDFFHGRGEMTVENISQQELTLYVPVGLIFGTPSSAAQNMVGYATDVQTAAQAGTATATAAATSVATATTAATATAVATAAPTVAATATAAPTVAATATPSAPQQLPITSEPAPSAPLALLVVVAVALLVSGWALPQLFKRG